MQVKNLKKWLNRVINRLNDSANNITIANIAEPIFGIQREAVVSFLPAHAEEMDFLSINEWMREYEDVKRKPGYLKPEISTTDRRHLLSSPVTMPSI